MSTSYLGGWAPSAQSFFPGHHHTPPSANEEQEPQQHGSNRLDPWDETAGVLPAQKGVLPYGSRALASSREDGARLCSSREQSSQVGERPRKSTGDGQVQDHGSVTGFDPRSLHQGKAPDRCRSVARRDDSPVRTSTKASLGPRQLRPVQGKLFYNYVNNRSG